MVIICKCPPNDPFLKASLNSKKSFMGYFANFTDQEIHTDKGKNIVPPSLAGNKNDFPNTNENLI